MRSRLIIALLLGSGAVQASDLPPAGTCVFSVRLVTEPGGLSRPGDTFIGDGIGLYEQPDHTLVLWRHEGDHSPGGTVGAKDEVWTLQSWQAERLRATFQQTTVQAIDFDSYARIRGELRTNSDIPIIINGATTRAVCHWQGVDFDFKSSQLRYHLDELAARDKAMSQLRNLLDAVAQLAGRHDLLLE